MKTKLLFLSIIMLMGFSVSTYAQRPEKSRTLNMHIGVAPYGFNTIKLRQKADGGNYGYDYKFKSYIGANLAFEKEDVNGFPFIFPGARANLILTEFSFAKSKFDEFKLNKNWPASYTLPPEKDVIEGCLDIYIGKYLVNEKKFKIPFYLGVGVDYINGKDIKKISPELAAKLLIKYYISYKVGIYAGVNGHLAGLTKIDSKNGDGEFGLSRTSAYAEAGFVIDLK